MNLQNTLNACNAHRPGLGPAFVLVHRLAGHLNMNVDKLVAKIAYKRRGHKDRKRCFDDAQAKRIHERDGGRCFHCGAEVPFRAENGRRNPIDHVIAHSQGGRTIDANGVVSCVSCNSKKKNHLFFIV